MDVRVIHDPRGCTLTIWLDDPARETVCTEVANEVVVMKGAIGRVIGVEFLNIEPPTREFVGTVSHVGIDVPDGAPEE